MQGSCLHRRGPLGARPGGRPLRLQPACAAGNPSSAATDPKAARLARILRQYDPAGEWRQGGQERGAAAPAAASALPQAVGHLLKRLLLPAPRSPRPAAAAPGAGAVCGAARRREARGGGRPSRWPQAAHARAAPRLGCARRRLPPLRHTAPAGPVARSAAAAAAAAARRGSHGTACCLPCTPLKPSLTPRSWPTPSQPASAPSSKRIWTRRWPSTTSKIPKPGGLRGGSPGHCAAARVPLPAWLTAGRLSAPAAPRRQLMPDPGANARGKAVWWALWVRAGRERQVRACAAGSGAHLPLGLQGSRSACLHGMLRVDALKCSALLSCCERRWWTL